jgi:hypothetical protein
MRILKRCFYCALREERVEELAEGRASLEDLLPPARHFLWAQRRPHRCSVQMDLDWAASFAAVSAVAAVALLCSAASLSHRFRKAQTASAVSRGELAGQEDPKTRAALTASKNKPSPLAAKFKKLAKERRERERTLTLVVLTEASLQILQLMAGALAQVIWSTDARLKQ